MKREGLLLSKLGLRTNFLANGFKTSFQNLLWYGRRVWADFRTAAPLESCVTMPVNMTFTPSVKAMHAAQPAPAPSPDPSIPGAAVWPDNYAEKFKPVFLGPRTETSMSAQHTSAGEIYKYRNEVKGIVPGYQGHVPRARDQYGESAVGGLAPVPWQATRHMGASVGHKVNAYGQNELLKDEQLHQKEEERFDAYDARNGGVMPNYAGHRPGARAVEATAAWGKWKQPTGDPQAIGGRPSSWTMNDTSDFTGLSGHSQQTTGQKESYRQSVGGVLPGYKGFVPGAIDKCGGSHFGGVAGVDKNTGLQTKKIKMDEDGDLYGLAQKGHGRDHKESTVGGAVKSGYAGHMPGKRDTWGMTAYETINYDQHGRLRGKKEYVQDDIAGNEFGGQAKTYHDDVHRALHEY
jgi:hypothetical protein